LTPSLSEFLVHPVASTSITRTPIPPKISIPMAKFLTCDESLAMLEEKEKIKKEALLEKERRKTEQT